MAARTPLVIVLAATAALRAGGQPSAQPAASYFYSNGQRIPLTIVPDTVAIDASAGPNLEADSRLAGEMAPIGPAEAARLSGLATSGIVAVKTRPGRVAQVRGMLRSSGVDAAGVVVEIGAAEERGVAVLTPEFIVRFKPDVPRSRIDAINERSGVAIVKEDGFRPNQFVLRTVSEDPSAALSAAATYHDLPEVDDLSHPNFIVARETRGSDPLRPEQWHLGIIKAEDAWRTSRGAGVIVAIIDPDGVEAKHEDLIAARFVNTREIPDNGRDDDGNGLIDDVNGWNFRAKGNDAKTARPHGTAAAAVAVARCDNSVGGCGVAPEATLLPIAQGLTVQDDADAFRYAARMGAGAISNSWGYSLAFPTTQVVEEAIADVMRTGRGGLGTVVLFAMTNEKRDNFGGGPDRYRDISSLPGVIAVGRSTDGDRWGHSGFGRGMAVLGPTNAARGSATQGCVPNDLAGTRDVTTADLMGADGYNRGIVKACGCNPSIQEHGNANYTRCFGGTSSATPLVAGVVALMLSANPALTASEVTGLLAETSDRIDAGPASYAPDAQSRPYSPTHGWGRVNALAAVSAAVRARGSQPTAGTGAPAPGAQPESAPPVAIAGRSVEPTGIARTAEGRPLYVWTNVRALVLSDATSREQILAALGGDARLVTGPGWSNDLATSNVIVVEASPEMWSAQSDRLAAASARGMVTGVGRVAFPDPAQQSSLSVLLNRFTFSPRPGASESALRSAAATHGLKVEPRPDGRYVLTPANPLLDPAHVAKLAAAMAASSVVAPGSLQPEWIRPVQRR